MHTNRRTWLKTAGLSLAGFSILQSAQANNFLNEEGSFATNDDSIRLTSNENPYGPSPLARKAMANVISSSNRYPWDNITKFREKIGKSFNLSKEHVVMGSGSSEILGLVGQYIAKDKSHFVAPDNTFRIWRRAAIDLGATVTRTDLTHDKKYDLAAMEKAIASNTKLLYICNPNNPTGTIINSDNLKSFIEEHSKKYMIVVDEAYLEYTNEPSMASFVAANKNVIVIKTFSKLFGLAGARIGYALAHPETITLLNSMQPWPNAGASAVAIAGAEASLDDTKFITSVVEKNNAEKKKLYDFYTSKNIPYIESYTNFIYYSLAAYSIDLQKELEKRKIFTGGIVEEKERWTRVTVGTGKEMGIYMNAVNEILK